MVKLDKVIYCLNKAGVEFNEDSYDRLNKAEHWIKTYMPQKMYKVLDSKNDEYISNLLEEDKITVRTIYNYLNENEIKEKEIQQFIYDTINNPALTKKENMQKQQHCFKVLYNLLFATDDGPRLYLFFASCEKEKYLHLLNI